MKQKQYKKTQKTRNENKIKKEKNRRINIK